MGRLLLAWKAATGIDLGRASFTNALRAGFDTTDDAGLLTAGRLESLVKARLEAVKRYFCPRMAGRTAEAMMDVLQYFCDIVVESNCSK
jgi:hypothetical protein